MTNLSDREIAEAAAEVGISPAELRSAMAERSGNLPARVAEQNSGIIAPNHRGQSHDFVETALNAPTAAALAHVRHFVEAQSGKHGHQQGNDQVDIVDDEKGIVYRLRAEDDGAQGSIVRIDLDVSAAKAKQTGMAVGATLGGFGALVATLSLFGVSLTGLAFFVPMLVMMGLGVGWMRRRSGQALAHARQVSNAAIANASNHEVKRLSAPR